MAFIEKWFAEFILTIVLCVIIYAEYLFYTGNTDFAIFVAIWAPTVLGIYNITSYREVKRHIFEVKYKKTKKITTRIKVDENQ